MSGLKLNLRLSRGGGDFLPSQLANLAGWWRYNTGITVTGSGVSTWADQSGNGKDFTQTTDSKRPAKQAGGEITFDGAAHVMHTGAITLNQPVTIYMLMKHITWTGGDYIFDGITGAKPNLQQNGFSPRLQLSAGTSLTNASFTLNTYGVLVAVLNGESSVLHVPGDTQSGAAGAGNMDGITLGANWADGDPSNMEIKEMIAYTAAHDATTRTQVIDYLGTL